MVGTFRQRDPMEGAPRFRSVNNPSLEELVAHLNRNTDKIASWQASRITIHTKGLAVPLQGRLAVERGRHVRLEVSSPRGVEVDVGSNSQHFWVWSRDMGPSIVTCKHENVDIVRQTEGIPFEPDWLMEVLSASPISTEGLTLDMSPEGDMARLERRILSPHRRVLRREILVDLKKGGVICEHSLYDDYGTRLALARLSSYVHDKPSGAVLPHRIVLDCKATGGASPQNQMAVTMDLGKVSINPKSIPSQVWVMPQRPGCELVELDKNVRHINVAARSGAVLSNRPDETPSGDDAITEKDETELPDSATDVTGHAHVTTNDDETTETDPAESEDDEELVDARQKRRKARAARFSDEDLPK